MTKFFRILAIPLSVTLIICLAVYGISGVIRGNAEGRELPIYCVECNTREGEAPKVSLSFDAAWGNEDTGRILDILAKYDVRVTFFMTGGWIEKYPDDVKAIAAAGHDLGNHSENHKHMSQITREQCKDEIMKPHERVKSLTGKEMILFRAPYGDYNNELLKTVRDNRYFCIQWDVDSLDWKDYGADAIVHRILNHKHLSDGSIILMHNGAKYTADALEKVIIGLKEKGYQIVPISEMIYKEQYIINHEGRQQSNT